MSLPRLQCRHCLHEWDRRLAGKKALRPPRRCPSCWIYLHVEDLDYVWLSPGQYEWNYNVHQDAQARRKRPAQRRAEPARSTRETQVASNEPEDILDMYPKIPDDQ